MLNPLFKYPGGKFDEFKHFSKYIPQNISNYYEPFAGSCGVYLHLKNEKRICGTSHINDISTDLINFLKEISGDSLGVELQKVNNAWKSLETISSTICDEYGDDFDKSVLQKQKTFDISPIAKRIDDLISDNSPISQINWGGHKVSEFIIDSLKDKAKRFTKKDITSNSESIVEMCISTAICQGFYFAIRALYNEWLTDSYCTKYTNTEKAVHWYFIRQMCYGSMFRFNKNGEFNVPYGGYSYNQKTFDDKISNITNSETINAFKDDVVLTSKDYESIINNGGKRFDDFIFLDPPYDSTFSSYTNTAFGHKEHERLADSLKNLNCKWMMVIKNTEFIYNQYKGWCNIKQFDKCYRYQARGREYDRDVVHLIIMNY